jgi:hypothetical protein
MLTYVYVYTYLIEIYQLLGYCMSTSLDDLISHFYQHLKFFIFAYIPKLHASD